MQPPQGYGPPQGYAQQPQQGYAQQPTPYGAPPAGYAPQVGPGAWREGGLVATNTGSVMTACCVKCGQMKPDVTPRMKDFEWVPAWAKVFYMLGRLGQIIIRAMSKQATLAVSLCNDCDGKWKAARWIYIGVAVGGFLGMILFSVGLGQVLPDAAAIFFFLFFIAWIVGMILMPYLVVRPRTLTPTLIEGPLVKLEGAHGAALQALPGQ